MVVAPMSFDECNKRLIARDILIDISEYISLTHTVAFNESVSHRLSEIAGLISFMNEIMGLHPHDFAISLASIERLGFFVSDTFKNHIRMMFGRQKSNLENERSFLKKNKLKEGVDFDMAKFRISGMDSDLEVEYKMTTLAFYKLLNNKYDTMFITLLNARIFQINSYYNKYISAYYSSKMNHLKSTIHGLTDDIGKLVIEHPHIKKSMVFNDIAGESEECKSDNCGCIRDSYISNDSDMNRQSFNSQVKTPMFNQRMAMGSYNDNDINWTPKNDTPIDANYISWTPQNNSPIDAMLESPRFSDEIKQIHSKLLNIIGSPHESLDILKNKFNSDTESIQRGSRSSIPKSMIGEGIDHDHVNMLRQRFSTYLHSSPKRMHPLRCTTSH